MALTKLDKASRIAIKDCMGAKKREKILVITDENKIEIISPNWSNEEYTRIMTIVSISDHKLTVTL